MSVTGLGFLAIYLANLGLGLFRHPIYGLYAYLLAFYGFPPGRWWGEGLPDLRWALLAAVVAMIGAIRLPPPKGMPSWINNGGAILLVLFTAWLWIQHAWALSSEEQMNITTLYSKYIILFFLLYRVLADDESIQRFFLAHVVGCAYFGWLAYSTHTGGRFEQIGGPGVDDANAFATHMVSAVLFGAMLFMRSSGWVRGLILVCMPLILNAIILAQSRGAFLGLLIGGLFSTFLKPNQHRAFYWSLAGMALVGFLALAPPSFWQRMDSITSAVEQSEEMDSSAESRWVILEAQWRMFKGQPLIGWGHRGTAVLSPSYMDAKWLARSVDGQGTGARSSHNTLASVLVEQGIIGMIIYLLIIVWAARRLLALRRMQRDHQTPPEYGWYTAAVGGALMAYLVAGQFADYLTAEVPIWCLVLIAILTRLSQTAVDEQAATSDGDAGRHAPQARRGLPRKAPRPGTAHPTARSGPGDNTDYPLRSARRRS